MKCDSDQLPFEMLLRQIGHLYMQHSIRSIQNSDCEFRGGQAGILFALKRQKTMSQRELAEALRIKPPSVTAAIKKLESSGLVMRQRDENDQRVMKLQLTTEGEHYVERIVQSIRETEALAMQNISQEEKLFLRRLLIQIRDNLSKGYTEDERQEDFHKMY